ncbi:universal stress protein [Halobacterium litoreum]|uniref:Universal stress protein n=1 Tax=Halobacterium litoreum TaxID=2039234 RepID=A0ABD5NIH8_9EURY|nr:universal stress protein [Halobacterium litoreum]UHH12206.1 universal stress protein [Halobacterium litoreum]
MVARVLVPMDDSEMAERALEYAIDAHPDAEISVLHVVGEPSATMGEAVGLALEDDVERAAETLAEDVLDRAREIASDAGVDVATEVRWGSPAKVIVGMADDFDVVVVGSHGGGLAERLFVGNIAKTVFQRSPVPVTVVR